MSISTEAKEAHFFAQESSSSHRIGVHPYRTQILSVELDSCAEKWASVASVISSGQTLHMHTP